MFHPRPTHADQAPLLSPDDHGSPTYSRSPSPPSDPPTPGLLNVPSPFLNPPKLNHYPPSPPLPHPLPHPLPLSSAHPPAPRTPHLEPTPPLVLPPPSSLSPQHPHQPRSPPPNPVGAIFRLHNVPDRPAFSPRVHNVSTPSKSSHPANHNRRRLLPLDVSPAHTPRTLWTS
ncbi:hypothetical protein BZA77DRAFT_363311 [Pyronema omphalodes]|nr:hypothetical protein BZA77DRAFT_363311 [Pyronema omphalodes]